MKTLKIKFINFWKNFIPSGFIMLKLLKNTYTDINFVVDQVCTDPDILFYSVFGDPSTIRPYKCIKIQYSGEPSYISDTNYFMGMFPSANKKLKLLNYEHRHYDLVNNTFNCYNHLTNLKYDGSEPNRKFCCFIVSNKGCHVRNNFFGTLCKYKKVDSCGKLFNNINYVLPRGTHGHSTENMTKFINQYKFMICFENSSLKYYTTEKIYNAIVAKTIPIYWGDPNIFDIYNKDAIIYLKADSSNLQQVLNTIKELDNDDKLYMEKLRVPKVNPNYLKYFKNKPNEIKQFFDPIIQNLSGITK